jgi:hypothetical protein
MLKDKIHKKINTQLKKTNEHESTIQNRDADHIRHRIQ